MKKNIKRIQNLILRKFSYVKSISTPDKVVYLTFDDGPEEGITEFVLEELKKYGFKATFFCRGDNAKKHPDLMQRLRNEGHAIGNHTYSHFHAYDTPKADYLKDVLRADDVLHTPLFRPPHGSLTLRTWWPLRHRKIIFWTLNSMDSEGDRFNFSSAINNLKTNTKPGDVFLFHFCRRHENETRQILPVYLKWLFDNGYGSKRIELS